MIARFWRGWTSAANADAYETLLRTTILPGIHRVPGYRGAILLRRPHPDGVEFATLTLFESMAAIRAFAGDASETAVVPLQARALLLRFDPTALHFDATAMPGLDLAAAA